VTLPEWMSDLDPQAPAILAAASDRVWEEGLVKKGISMFISLSHVLVTNVPQACVTVLPETLGPGSCWSMQN
jgi:hypothetical protein